MTAKQPRQPRSVTRSAPTARNATEYASYTLSADVVALNPQLAAAPAPRKARTISRVPTEEMEQMWFIAWFDACADLLPPARCFHVPNGGYRSAKTAARMKAAGQRAGVWDLLIPWKGMLLDPGTKSVQPLNWASRAYYVGLVLEIKRRDRRNHLSPAQDDWGAYFRSQGWRTVVCYSATEAATATLDYFDVDDASRRELLRRMPLEAR